MGEASQRKLAVATRYADTKRAQLNAAKECQAQGVKFIPMVVGAAGASLQLEMSSFSLPEQQLHKWTATRVPSLLCCRSSA